MFQRVRMSCGRQEEHRLPYYLLKDRPSLLRPQQFSTLPFRITSPLCNKAEDLANRLGYYLLFVRMNDADHNSAGYRGNHALVHRVLLFFEFDSKKA